MMDPVPSGPDFDRSAEAPSNPSDKDVARMAQEGVLTSFIFCLLKQSHQLTQQKYFQVQTQ